MKKLLSLVLVLALSSVASAVTVTLEDPGVVLMPSDDLVIGITTDGMLMSLDAIITVDGPASIVGAISPADAADYGWDAGFSYPPVLTDDSASIGVGDFMGSNIGLVGYVVIHCDGEGDVTVTIAPNQIFGGSWDMTGGIPDIAGSIVIQQVPEPATMLLLGLGGLFLRRRK